MAVYVVSDIHGQYNLFLKGLDEINFSEKDYLWCLGDAIDRGPDGIMLLQHIMIHDNMDLLIGNHELMMLDALDQSGESLCDERDNYLWLEANGGRITFDNYKELSKEERWKLLEWMKSRYVIKTIEVSGRRFCLTHSFYKERCENKMFSEMDYRDAWNITWSSIWRNDEFTHAMDIYPQYSYTFVNGHVPVQIIRRQQGTVSECGRLKSFTHNNVICIDGGCALENVGGTERGIIFLRLDDMEEYAVSLS